MGKMVHDPDDNNGRSDERDGKEPTKPVEQKIDANAIYNTPYHLPMAGLEKGEVYPY